MKVEQVSGGFEAAAWRWHEAKLFVEHSITFSFDVLHVFAGVIVLLVAAVLLRKAVSSWWPWSVVLVITLVNELLDLRIEEWPQASMQYGEAMKDLLLTMFLPTVLLVTSRKFPRLYR